MSANLRSLKYTRGSLEVIDQLKLPHTIEYIKVTNIQEGWKVIRDMNVRGAPLIAITAVLSLAVEVAARQTEFAEADTVVKFLLDSMTYLRTSRPTAVNLFVATDEMSGVVKRAHADKSLSAVDIIRQYTEACEAMLAFDLRTNKAIGENGARRILELVKHHKVRVLTICNTGSLATAGHGTALGVVRSLHAMGRLEQVYACETRPYDQGARLTAFEIVQDELPGTLITDSMAASLMAQGKVDCVVVGADRVAANGDVANKIGTYQLAVSAKYHAIPFFAAVPTTSLDLSLASGNGIHIEERAAKELTSNRGHKIAPDGINVWNPAFDVTPCALIKGIITELGMIESSSTTDAGGGEEGIIHIADSILKAAATTGPSSLTIQENIHGDLLARCRTAAIPVAAPTAYRKLDEVSVAQYIADIKALTDLLDVESVGSNVVSKADIVKQMSVKEVGDGNLNFVYIVKGPTGKSFVLKQALPYVRCVGESWPLSLTRAHFECKALREQYRLTGGECVPEVYHFDEAKACIIMQYIDPPHTILRKLLIERRKISGFAVDIGLFCARTLFISSALCMDGGELRSKVGEWSENKAMCALTEKVIFTDPYMDSANNRWTSPYLDEIVNDIRRDTALQLAAAYHKSIFLCSTQALLHGDLHTGSVMAKEGSTFVIDPEFAFYGPIGFDLGAFLANVFLSYFSQFAVDNNVERDDYAEWLLLQIRRFYDTFSENFVQLWSDRAASADTFNGEVYHGSIYGGPPGAELLRAAQIDYMQRIWRDAIGFTGMKIIRRIIGIAHVEDLESISDLSKRATCELKALRFARSLVMCSYKNSMVSETFDVSGVEGLIAHARQTFEN